MKPFVPLARAAIAVALFTFTSLNSSAQSLQLENGKIEIGLGLGPSAFLGDLGGAAGIGKPFVKDLDWPIVKLSKGLFVNINPREWYGIRLAFNHTKLEGNDALTNDKGGRESSRIRRNQYFQSNIWELYAGLEVYPTVFFERYDGLKGKLRPYGIVGIGAFHFNPKGYYYSDPTNVNTKQLVALQPLRLEGQGMAEYPDRKQYKLTQMEIPMGFGFKYYIKENMYVGLEVLHRKTFTDYIDNVSTKYVDPIVFSNPNYNLTPQQITWANQLYSREVFSTAPDRNRAVPGKQRGDPTENDAFFSTILRMGWRINGDNSPNSRARRQMRCPIYF